MHAETEKHQDKHPRPDHELTFKITALSGESDIFTYEKSAKISDVIAGAIKRFKFSSNDKYDLVFKEKLGEPLEHNRTLASYGVKDGDEFVLTSTGGGV